MNVTEAARAASADPISAGSGPDDPRVLRTQRGHSELILGWRAT